MNGLAGRLCMWLGRINMWIDRISDNLYCAGTNASVEWCGIQTHNFVPHRRKLFVTPGILGFYWIMPIWLIYLDTESRIREKKVNRECPDLVFLNKYQPERFEANTNMSLWCCFAGVFSVARKRAKATRCVSRLASCKGRNTAKVLPTLFTIQNQWRAIACFAAVGASWGTTKDFFTSFANNILPRFLDCFAMAPRRAVQLLGILRRYPKGMSTDRTGFLSTLGMVVARLRAKIGIVRSLPLTIELSTLFTRNPWTGFRRFSNAPMGMISLIFGVTRLIAKPVSASLGSTRKFTSRFLAVSTYHDHLAVRLRCSCFVLTAERTILPAFRGFACKKCFTAMTTSTVTTSMLRLHRGVTPNQSLRGAVPGAICVAPRLLHIPSIPKNRTVTGILPTQLSGREVLRRAG